LKPLRNVLLVAAGVVVGALVMKVAQRPTRLPVPPPAPAAVVAQAPAPIPEPAAPKAQARPSPFVPPLAGNPEPVAVAQSEPAPEVAPPAQPVPPVRVEPENATPPPPGPGGTPPEPHKVTLNAGMLLPVRLDDGLSSGRNAPGDAFLATLDKELVVDGFVIAERGARVEGRVVASNPGGKVKRVAGIAVELTRLHTSDGQNVAIQTDSFERHAEPDRGGDVEKVAAGAVAGDVILTQGKPATLPSETRIGFRLRAPLILTEQL